MGYGKWKITNKCFDFSNSFISGPSLCRNIAEDTKYIARNQDCYFTMQHLKRTLTNGEIVDRNWVLYSPSQNSLICFMCRLFGTVNPAPNKFSSTGFTDFHIIQRAFKQHEISKSHVLSELAYRNQLKRSSQVTLDTTFMIESKNEIEYWRSILKRIVAVIKFLGSRGLPFRGSDQTFGSIRNGNFLGILDLLSKFDPLIAEHIARYGNKGRGNIISLSSYASKCSEESSFELKIVFRSSIVSFGHNL